MDIRRTTFWPRIEGIFDKQTPFDTADGSKAPDGGRLCGHLQFLDRLRGASERAKRNQYYVLLILLQLTPDGRGDAAAKAHAVDPVELLMCGLGSFIRASDSLCSLGDGRFAMLLEEVRDPSAVPMVIEKLNTTLMARRGSGRPSRGLHTNLGVSLFKGFEMPFEQIWLHTETALEQAISYGPGCYSISPMVTEQTVMERVELSRELYRAYRNDEFEAVYQPIVDVADKHILGLECLLRWRHPMRGYLRPEAFLPLLEETGLIVPVGEKLLNLACRMASKLMEDGHPLTRICVNISARQLTDRGFLLSVLDALYETGLPAHALQLEFPESVLGREQEVLRRLLPELRNAGVRLAVDQFGAGNAPLAELVCLPIDLVKLDCSLVECLPRQGASRAIVSGTFALAGAAGMAVAAVGVEDEEQTAILEEMGCREAQGRYYGRPMPAEQVGALLSS